MLGDVPRIGSAPGSGDTGPLTPYVANSFFLRLRLSPNFGNGGRRLHYYRTVAPNTVGDVVGWLVVRRSNFIVGAVLGPRLDEHWHQPIDALHSPHARRTRGGSTPVRHFISART